MGKLYIPIPIPDKFVWNMFNFTCVIMD